MVDILPCPFCGAEDESDICRSPFGKAFIRCLACDAQGPTEREPTEAIAVWNDMSIASTRKSDVSKNSEKIDTMRFELVKAAMPIAGQIAINAQASPGDFEIGIAFGAVKIADTVLAQLKEK